MRLGFLFAGSLLLTKPLLGSAQQAAIPTPTGRFYVGLSAYASNYLPISQVWQESFLLPLQVTSGYRFSSRLAVQASVAYNGRSNSYAGLSYDEPAANQPPAAYSYAGQYRQRLTSASLLARYTLTKQAANRLQIDLLGGLTLVHTDFSGSYTRTAGASGASSAVTDYRTNNLLPTAGLGARYHLATNLDATGILLLGVPVTGYGLREISPSTSVGLQYQFKAK